MGCKFPECRTFPIYLRTPPSTPAAIFTGGRAQSIGNFFRPIIFVAQFPHLPRCTGINCMRRTENPRKTDASITTEIVFSLANWCLFSRWLPLSFGRVDSGCAATTNCAFALSTVQTTCLPLVYSDDISRMDMVV